jgi:hypothetical protein
VFKIVATCRSVGMRGIMSKLDTCVTDDNIIIRPHVTFDPVT